MSMEDFWAITCIVIILYYFFKPKNDNSTEYQGNTVKNRWESERQKQDRKRKREADDLITMIIPTINNDGK